MLSPIKSRKLRYVSPFFSLKTSEKLVLDVRISLKNAELTLYFRIIVYRKLREPGDILHIQCCSEFTN